MKPRLIAIPCAAALALSACATQTVAPTGSRNPTYSTDLKNKAATCTAPDVALARGQDATATITTSGGGWCGIAVTMNGDALTAGLLTQKPRAGHVYVHTVGDVTRVDYTPLGAPTADSFAVQFIPGDVTMRVTVTTAPGSAPAAAAPAPAAATPAATAPARSSTGGTRSSSSATRK